MVWAVVTTVGFVLLTGLITVMARSNTARWERDHRAPQAAARAHGAAMRRAWASTLSRWEHEQEEPAGPGSRLASLHLPHVHLPHVHLPAGLTERLPHPHVPHLHVPHVRLPRRDRTGGAAGRLPAPAAEVGAEGGVDGRAEGSADESAAGVAS